MDGITLDDLTRPPDRCQHGVIVRNQVASFFFAVNKLPAAFSSKRPASSI